MSVVETRWFRNERWADTLWMLALAKIQTLMSATTTVTGKLVTPRMGIRVWVDDVLISNGTVAIVEFWFDAYQEVLSAKWTPPETPIDGKYVKVEIRVWVGEPEETTLVTFRTEVFVGRKLDPIEWTVYYTGSATYTLFPTVRSSITFHWDGDFLSRIEGFGHSPIVIPKRIQMDGLVMFLT